jgi:TP901 family phage tail tape measure protein
VATEQVDVVYSADVAGYTRSLGEAIAVTEQYAAASGGLQGKLNSLASTMSTKVLTAAKGFSSANQTLTGQAAAYQQALAPLEATTVTLGGGFDKLSEATRRLARDFPVGINQAVQTMRQLQQLGAAQRQMSSLATSMTQLGAATGESIPAVTYEMTQLSRSFGNFNAKSVTGMADSLVSVTNKFGGGAQSVLQFSNAIAPLAKQAGLGQTAVMGFSTAFARLGEDGYRSANAFNKMLLDMDSSIRTGSDTMRVYSSTVGVTVDQFKALFQANPAEALTQLVEGLNKQGPDAIRTLEMMGLEGTRTLSSLTNLAKSGDLRAIRDEALTSYGSGASQEAAQAAFGGLNDQLTKLNETLSQVGAEAGKPFLNFMEQAAGGATRLAGVFQEIAGSKFFQVVATVAGVAGGLGAAAMKGGGAAVMAGGALQLGSMLPSVARDFLGSRAGRVGMLGAGGAFLGAQALGVGGDLPLGLLGMGALGMYGRYGRDGQGSSLAASGFRGITDLMMLGPLRAAANPRGAWNREIEYSSVRGEMRQRLQELRDERAVRGTGEGWGDRMGLREYASRRFDIAAGMTREERRAAVGEPGLRAAGRYLTGGAALAGGALRLGASSALGMVGGVGGLAALGGYSLYSTAATSAQRAAEATATGVSDPLSMLNEFRNATGRAGEAMASLAASAAGAAQAISEITSANQNFADAVKVTQGELEKLADWEARSPESVTEGSAQDIAAQVALLTTNLPEDLALAMQDVAKRRGTAMAQEVGDILAAQGGGVGPLRAAGFNTLRGAGGGRFGGFLGSEGMFGNGQPGANSGPNLISDLLKGKGQGAELGLLVGQGLASEQTRAGQLRGEAGRYETMDSQVREMIDVVSGMAKEGTLTTKSTQAAITALTTAGVDEKAASQIVGRAGGRGWGGVDTAGALQSWEGSTQGSTAKQMESVLQDARSDAEKRIRASAGIGGETGYFGGSQMTSRGSVAAEELFGTFDKVRDAGFDLSEALEKAESGQIDLTEAEITRLKAIENPEAVGTRNEAAQGMVGAMRKEGLTNREIQQEMNRLIEVGQLPQGDPYRLLLEATRGEAGLRRGVQQQGMSRTERWAEAQEDWQYWKKQGAPDDEALLAEYEGSRQANMAAKEERRQYMLERLKAEEAFQFQSQRSAADFARQQLYAEADFQKQMSRQSYDFTLGMERQQEDYQLSVQRTEHDYNLQRGRSVQDFNRSMSREAEDHKRQMGRLAEDTAKGMADPYQRIFGQATYSPQGLASNLKEQERLFREQLDTIDKLKKRGMSQETIDQLGLNEASNAQQAIALGEASRADIARLNRLTRRRTGIGGEFAEGSTSVRRTEEDRQIGLERQREDFSRSLRRGDRDFRRSLARQDADFKKAMGRATTDFNTSIARANEDFLTQSARAYTEFALQMSRAEEDLRRSFRDINGDMKSVTREYRKFVRGETTTLEGLVTDTDDAIAESILKNREAMLPPSIDEYQSKWTQFVRELKQGIKKEGFDLAPGITIYLGQGGQGGQGGPPTGNLPGALTAIGGSDEGHLTSYFRQYNPSVWSWDGGYHNGQDFSPSAGPIFASVSGVVTASGNSGSYAGNHVTLATADGAQVTYAHMQTGSNLPLVGSTVAEGQRIGMIGETGNADGAHLHVDVWKNGTYVSPLPYLKDGAIVSGEQQVKVGEHGSEVVIPLNERGLAFMTQSLKEVARHVDGVQVGATQAARYSQQTVYNQQNYSYDQSTKVLGPVSVVSSDPADMGAKMAAKARRDRALNGVGS